MSEREGFIGSICAEPAEDTPRLAFADYLDEHGEPERAEFIRIQVANPRDPSAEAKTAVTRESQLLLDYGEAWLTDELGRHLGLPNGGSTWRQVVPRPGGFPAHGGTLTHMDVGWRRGFVTEFVIDLMDWFVFGPTILEVVPVESVIFQDEEAAVRLQLFRRKPGLAAVLEESSGGDEWEARDHVNLQPDQAAVHLCRPNGWLAVALDAIDFPVPDTAACQNHVRQIWDAEMRRTPGDQWPQQTFYRVVSRAPWPEPTGAIDDVIRRLMRTTRMRMDPPPATGSSPPPA